MHVRVRVRVQLGAAVRLGAAVVRLGAAAVRLSALVRQCAAIVRLCAAAAAPGQEAQPLEVGGGVQGDQGVEARVEPQCSARERRGAAVPPVVGVGVQARGDRTGEQLRVARAVHAAWLARLASALVGERRRLHEVGRRGHGRGE